MINKRDPENKKTALMIVCDRRQIAGISIANLLLKCDSIDIDMTDKNGYTATMHSILEGNFALLDVFLQRKDLNVRLSSNQNGKHCSCGH